VLAPIVDGEEERKGRMGNHNTPAENRKARLKRRRHEVTRFIEKCESANRTAQAKGEPLTSFTKAIRDFKEFRK
jgi:hypothetical protein